MGKIRLVIVDDSIFVRKSITRLFSEHPDVLLAGSAACGEELLENWDLWKPEVILLDLSMPGMGGMKTLDHIVAMSDARVILFSTHSSKDAAITLEALDRGAADYIDKQSFSLADFERLRAVLVDKIRAVTGRVILDEEEPPKKRELRKPDKKRDRVAKRIRKRVPPKVAKRKKARTEDFGLVVVGASTGGPPAVRRVLESLGQNMRIPVVIVQHMSNPFLGAFASRLNDYVTATVREASDREELLPGHVYLAPADRHLRIEKANSRLIVKLTDEPEDLIHCPAVDVLFQSAAEALGDRVVAALLTGMGKDGAVGMVALAEAGAYTIAQDEDSCVVYGMPRAAVELQAVEEVLPLDSIGKRICKLTQ